MRRLFLLLGAFSIISGVISQTIDDIIIGGGNQQFNRQPFGVDFGYERSASIYKIDEINLFGTITQLGWNVQTSQSTNIPTRIYLKTTAANFLNSTPWAELIYEATLVYDATRQFNSTGWITIDISDFIYGSDNLMVLCETNYGGIGTSATPRFFCTNYQNQNLHEFYFANTYPPLSYGTLSYNRPDIQITINSTGSPGNFSATTLSSSQISITFLPNTDNDNLVIVYDLDSTFTVPEGTPPAIGESFAGGTLIYNDNGFLFNHESLASDQVYYYDAFSYDGSEYCHGMAANATTYCETTSTFPIIESFDDESFPPVCWSNRRTAGSDLPGTWERKTSGIDPVCSPFSGSAMIQYNSLTYHTPAEVIMVSLPFNLPDTTYCTRFWMYRNDGSPEKADLVNVYYNTQNNLTGATLLGTVHRSCSLSPVVAMNRWYEYSFNLPASQSENPYFLIFEAVGDRGNNIFIDEILVISKRNIWTGNVSTEWNNAGNWSIGNVPNPYDKVVIPALPAGLLFPVIANGISAECYDIIVAPAADLIIQPGGTLIVKRNSL
jgi:hypothetical protein